MELTTAAVTPPAGHAARRLAGAANAPADDAGVRWNMGLMQIRDKKINRELEVFAAFAACSDLKILAESIRHMKEPHPDISCMSERFGAMAFELVQLINESFARQVVGAMKTQRGLYAYYDGLSGPRKMQFQAQYGNAMISVKFAASLSLGKRDRLAPQLIDALLSLDLRFTGTIRNRGSALAKGIERISVDRLRANGPLFNVVVGGSQDDPVLPRIRAKFRNKYVAQCPIDLLGYVDWGSILPESAWIPDLDIYLDATFPRGNFRRVWVYSFQSDVIIYRYPSNSACI